MFDKIPGVSEIKYERVNYTVDSNFALNNGSQVTKTLSIQKDGYYPLSIIGFNQTSSLAYVYAMELTSQNIGSGVITCKLRNSSGSNISKMTLSVDVLWETNQGNIRYS